MSWVSNTLLPFEAWPFGTLQIWGGVIIFLPKCFGNHTLPIVQPGEDQESHITYGSARRRSRILRYCAKQSLMNNMYSWKHLYLFSAYTFHCTHHSLLLVLEFSEHTALMSCHSEAVI